MMWNKKQTLREKRLAVEQWFLSTTCRAVLVCAVVCLVLLNVLKTSTVSTQGYELGDLQKEIVRLSQETSRLDVQIADYRSIHSIETRVQDLHMVASGNISYIASLGSTVARR